VCDILALTCGESGVVGGVGVTSVVVGGFSGGGGGGSTASATVKEPRHAERQQRQPDPGRDGDADRRSADRSCLASPMILYNATPSRLISITG